MLQRHLGRLAVNAVQSNSLHNKELDPLLQRQSYRWRLPGEREVIVSRFSRNGRADVPR